MESITFTSIFIKDNCLSKRVTLSTRNTLNILKERKALKELPPEVPDKKIMSKSDRATITESNTFILLETYYDIPRPIILSIMSMAKI